MLEEVSEPALAVLDLVAAAGADDRDERDLTGCSGFYEVSAEPVLELNRFVGKGRYPSLGLAFLLRVDAVCRSRDQACRHEVRHASRREYRCSIRLL